MVAETTTTATTGGTVLCEVVESQALAVVKVLCVLHGQAANRPFLNMQDRIVDGL